MKTEIKLWVNAPSVENAEQVAQSPIASSYAGPWPSEEIARRALSNVLEQMGNYHHAGSWARSCRTWPVTKTVTIEVGDATGTSEAGQPVKKGDE